MANTQPQIFGKLTSAFGSSNDTSANNTWYVGKGVKPDTYVKYSINNLGTNNNQAFIMTIYFQKYNSTGKYWIAPVYVFDNPSKSSDNNTPIDSNRHIINGTFRLSDEDMGVMQGSIIPPQIAQYKDAYAYPLDWLREFATKSFSPSLTAFYWNMIGAPDLFELPLLRHTENVTVPAGTFNTTVINWHRGPAHDNKIWINKDFPYPIKVRVYAEVVNPPAQIQYEFELLEYGKGRPDVSKITSSNGSSIGIPEFPSGILLPIVASVITATIFLSRRRLGWNS
jgi:hypothetical protein